MAYGAGLRASEVVSLKMSDIDSSRMVIRVEQGKGRKDRYAMLSEPLLHLLRTYWKASRPQGWLFPGQNPVNPLTTRHLGRGAGLVDEDQALRCQVRLSLEPGPAAVQHVRALLLAGVRGFF